MLDYQKDPKCNDCGGGPYHCHYCAANWFEEQYNFLKNKMVQFKVKLIEGGQAPTKATEHSSGFDLYARIPKNIYDHDYVVIRPGENLLIPVGFCMELPHGYEGVIRPRSGMAAKDSMVACIGTIDADYRGELSVNLFNHSWKHYSVKDGQRIGQMVIQVVPSVEMTVVTELSESGRGEKGFGSSGV